MALRDQLTEDLKQAMRRQDAVRLRVIRGIKAAMLEVETKGQRTTLDDEGILAVIAKEVKDRQDAMAEYARGGREDLVSKAQEELAVLQAYLPKPLSDSELAALISQAIGETGAVGARDMGKVMAWLMPKTRGRADGRRVSEMVKDRLSSGPAQ